MNEVVSPFFREGRHYSYDDIKGAFRLDDDVQAKKQINTLKRFNVLKQVRAEKPDYSELSDFKVFYSGHVVEFYKIEIDTITK